MPRQGGEAGSGAQELWVQQRTPPVLSPACCTVSSGHTEVPLASHHPNPHLYS